MPLRLPLRRRMGPTAEKPFRRRAPPTPQATRLMRVSLGAGIALLVLLGIVFVPIALRYGQVQSPVITLRYEPGSPINVTVVRASLSYPLSTYTVDLVLRNGTGNDTIRLGPLAPDATSRNFTFTDGDADGTLSAGDRFSVPSHPATTYEVLVFHASRGMTTAVGFLRFP